MVKLKQRLFSAVAGNIPRIISTAVYTLILSVICCALYCLLNIVTVEYAGKTKTVLSVFSNQDHLIELSGFNPQNNDSILYTTYQDGYSNITIESPFDVNITVDGATVTAQTLNGTVSECLAQAGIVLGEHDYTEPSLHTPLNQGDSIRVYRVEYVDTQYEESVPFETEYKAHSLLYRFKSRQYVLQSGVEGTNLVTYRERYVDGEMESSLITKVEVVSEPVNQVVLKYADAAVSPLSAPAGVTIENNVPSSYKQVFTNVSATGYTSSGGRGASGLGLYCGTVAVNPNIIPFGSKLYITSADGSFVYGFAIATDTGSSLLQGSTGVDLYYDTYKEASMNWRNVVNVYVIE